MKDRPPPEVVAMWERYQAHQGNRDMTIMLNYPIQKLALFNLVQEQRDEAAREAFEEAARIAERMTLTNSIGPLMDGGFNFAKECAARDIRSRAAKAGEETK